MVDHPVHWHEGMFLRPHHFQAAARHAADQLRLNVQWDSHYSWGVRSIDINADALRNYRLVVPRLRARMRDGTLVSVPDAQRLEELDLKPALAAADAVDVHLAVPDLRLGEDGNIGEARDGSRFQVRSAEALADENSGASGQRVQFRHLNLRLLTGADDPAGYQTLKIAAIKKSAQAGAVPELVPEFIPALLACDGWKPLVESILHPIYDRIGQIVKQLAEQVRNGGINFDSPAPGDRAKLEMLRVLNAALAYEHVLHFAEGVHPLWAYAELARLVGHLAVFGDHRETPPLPRYDHDDLGDCFWKAKHYIDALLELNDFGYFEQAFYGTGLRIQGDIKPEWLAEEYQMFVGVKAPLSAEECRRLLTGRLNMKLGSANRVDEIFRQGQRGLRFQLAPLPPRVLPKDPDLFFFEVDRSVEPEEWNRVRGTLKMAVRLAEQLFAGPIEGEKTISIRADNKTIPFQFTLFVVPPSAQERRR